MVEQNYSNFMPDEDKRLIIEALQRLHKQRSDVIQTINNHPVDLTIESFALDSKKIEEMLISYGSTVGI